MKVTRILYFVFFIFALNFIAPNNEHNGYVEAKKKLTPAEIKKRNQKLMMYSAIASGVAVLLGASIEKYLITNKISIKYKISNISILKLKTS
ncbi:hypothetical protein PFTANZ_03165 [Plasmodium falciparum Tanzania (2000708)]|uniref:Early transcribed membrane protein 11.1 n=1 Tax=Plasmodium falciparum Tanzania (2000708) TaxID=1036725 RepID=A0A024W7G7_PLAFA|nr:hypothetical protein PFTANZ_03165 [Plasmodium falciparum Tanzania (2000708)]